MTHILYIIGQNNGGLPHYTAELANAVAKFAHVTVLKPSKTTADGLFSHDIDVYETFEPMNVSQQNLYQGKLNIKENIKGMMSYRNIKSIEQIDPDIVHDPTDFFPQIKLFLRLYNMSKKYPFILTLHELQHGGGELLSPLKIADFVTSLIPDIEKNMLIVHSNRQKNRLVDQGVSKQKITVIPHGAYGFFKEYNNNAIKEENCLLFFGSITPPKGLDTLISAVPLIRSSIPDLKVIVAGDGEISTKSKKLINQYQSNFEVHNSFIPNNRVGELFCRSQAIVLPYKEGWLTGHSGSLATAYAFGTPAIATNSGPLPELVERPGCGLTVPPEDPPALARAIVRMLNDDHLRQGMEQRSLKRAQELSWENIAKKHMKVYQNVVNEQRDPK